MLKFTRTITAIFWFFSTTGAMAAQSSVVMPTTNPHPSTGFTMMEFTGTWLNPALQSLLSNNSGTTAPTNGPSNAPMAWEYWIDTSASPATWKIYDGASWVTIGTINATTHILGIPVTNISGLGTGVAAAAAIATNANGGFPTVSVSTTAPSTTSLFQPWLNTTATPYVWNIWDGASWVALGTINATTHAFTSPTLNLAATSSGGFGGVSGNLPIANMPVIGADTILGNATVGNATPTALTALPSTFTGTSGHVLPYLDGANIWTPLQLFNGGIGGSVSYTGAQAADFFPNNFTLTFNALSNPGHNNYGFGPTCIVASASYSGQLLCNYAVLNVNSLGSVGFPNDQFIGQAAWVTANANTTDVDASLFGGNDNVTINGTGWVYAVGREIDVTATKAIANKMGLRIVYGTADAFRGSGTYDNMIDLINAGSAGSHSVMSITQLGTGTFDNILVVNTGVVTAGGRIITSPNINLYAAGQVISGAAGGTTSAAFQAISATPTFAWENSGGGADSKWWQAIGGSAAWTLSAVNDLGSAANVALQINRSGYTITDLIAGSRTYPSVDNSFSLGLAANRWSSIYGVNAILSSVLTLNGATSGTLTFQSPATGSTVTTGAKAQARYFPATINGVAVNVLTD